MIKSSKFSRTQAELLLAAVILARSVSFVMTKVALRYMGVFSLLGLRFLAAFIFLLPFGWQRIRGISQKTLLRGMVLGAAFFSILAAEVSGLRTADASTAAFLENTAIVLVPFLEAIINRRLPTLSVVVSVVLALGGVALLTLKGGAFSISTGELLCLLAAFLYACAIILTDRLSKQDDPLTIGILQVGFMGVYSIITAFICETPYVPTSATAWAMILTLAVVCSGFGFTLQPLAQSGTTSERAGLFCALGPVGAAMSGYLFLHEKIGASSVLGIMLILGGMLFVSISGRFGGRRTKGR